MSEENLKKFRQHSRWLEEVEKNLQMRGLTLQEAVHLLRFSAVDIKCVETSNPAQVAPVLMRYYRGVHGLNRDSFNPRTAN